MNFIYFFPVIGFIIAWLATSILFHFLLAPKTIKKLLGIKFQGVLYQLQPKATSSLGTFLEDSVKRNPVIDQVVLNPQNLVTVRPEIEKNVTQFLEEKLPEQMPAISMFIGKKTTDKLKNTLMEQIDTLLPKALDKFLQKFKDNFDGQQFAQKIINETLMQSIAILLTTHLKKKLQVALGLLGLFIGLVLMIVTLVFR